MHLATFLLAQEFPSC
uniref:Uncharacterized protein n=1 Tax=Arundo donax TaxID=35708 RepID=A0A0A8ZPR3_ARUDO